MTKKSHNLYTIQESYKQLDKYDMRVTRLFWFSIGFLLALLVTALIFLPYVK